jgi:hypothetical protein
MPDKRQLALEQAAAAARRCNGIQRHADEALASLLDRFPEERKAYEAHLKD